MGDGFRQSADTATLLNDYGFRWIMVNDRSYEREGLARVLGSLDCKERAVDQLVRVAEQANEFENLILDAAQLLPTYRAPEEQAAIVSRLARYATMLGDSRSKSDSPLYWTVQEFGDYVVRHLELTRQRGSRFAERLMGAVICRGDPSTRTVRDLLTIQPDPYYDVDRESGDRYLDLPSVVMCGRFGPGHAAARAYSVLLDFGAIAPFDAETHVKLMALVPISRRR